MTEQQAKQFFIFAVGWATGWLGAGLLAHHTMKKIDKIDKKYGKQRIEVFEQMVAKWGPYVPLEVKRETLELMEFHFIINEEFDN